MPNLQKQHIVQELKGGLQLQQNIFTKATAKNNVFTSLHQSYKLQLPFEANHNAVLALGENELVTPDLLKIK